MYIIEKRVQKQNIDNSEYTVLVNEHQIHMVRKYYYDNMYKKIHKLTVYRKACKIIQRFCNELNLKTFFQCYVKKFCITQIVLLKYYYKC